MKILKTIAPLVFAAFALISCAEEKKSETAAEVETFRGKPFEIRGDIDSVFARRGYEGCFILLDETEGKFIIYNEKLCARRVSPASTFKIPNSLIGLETGVISGEDHLFKWDGKKRWLDAWNRDHTLASALKHSVVWYYQKIAREVGKKRMQAYLDSIDYGNRKIGGDVDKFWLDGSLKISPAEQVEFLQKMRNYELPFSKENVEIVKKIMLHKSTDDYVVRAKTGTSLVDTANWFVGFVKKRCRTYFFALQCDFGEDNKLDENDYGEKIFMTREILDILKVTVCDSTQKDSTMRM